MKLLLTFVLCSLLICCKSQKKFVKITPERGMMENMLEMGEFGKAGTIQVYFIGAIEENSPFFEETNRIKMEQGFIVLRLRRTIGGNAAYRLLDSLNACERAFNMDISEDSKWSEEEKLEIITLRNLSPKVKDRFGKHVKIYVEAESLKTGISNEAYLQYE